MHSSHRESSSCSFHSRYIACFLAFLSINTDRKCQLLQGIIERASTEQVEVLVEYPNNIECLSIPPFRHPSLPTSLPPSMLSYLTLARYECALLQHLTRGVPVIPIYLADIKLDPHGEKSYDLFDPEHLKRNLPQVPHTRREGAQRMVNQMRYFIDYLFFLLFFFFFSCFNKLIVITARYSNPQTLRSFTLSLKQSREYHLLYLNYCFVFLK